MDKRIALLEGKLIDLNDKIIKEEIKQNINECIAMIGKLKEGFTDDHNGPLEKELDDMLRQIETAKKALAIANRLPRDERKAHQGKLFGFLNKLRFKRNDIADRVYTNSPMSKQNYQHPADVKPAVQDDSKLPPLWRKQQK